MNHQALSSFIWSVADLLRGDYKQSEYGRVILPFTILRRLDCVLEATKPAAPAELVARTKVGVSRDYRIASSVASVEEPKELSSLAISRWWNSSRPPALFDRARVLLELL